MPRPRNQLRDLNPPRAGKRYGVLSRYNEYLNLLLNAVKIVDKGSGNPLPYVAETFAKRTLFERGSVGYDKLAGHFYYVYGMGLDAYGRPTTLEMVTADGFTFQRPASYDANPDGAYKIDGLPNADISMGDIIEEATDFMTNCDIAARQNLEACKTPYIVVCKSDELRLSFDQALQQKALGQAAIVVSPDLGEGLKAISVSTPYLVDKFTEARDTERDHLLTKLGILTANINKKERVQSAEVNSTLGQASDYVYLLIDTFNKQCETYGLPFEMKYNGSMEEIYLDNSTDVNKVERGEAENGD